MWQTIEEERICSRQHQNGLNNLVSYISLPSQPLLPLRVTSKGGRGAEPGRRHHPESPGAQSQSPGTGQRKSLCRRGVPRQEDRGGDGALHPLRPPSAGQGRSWEGQVKCRYI